MKGASTGGPISARTWGGYWPFDGEWPVLDAAMADFELATWQTQSWTSIYAIEEVHHVGRRLVPALGSDILVCGVRFPPGIRKRRGLR